MLFKNSCLGLLTLVALAIPDWSLAEETPQPVSSPVMINTTIEDQQFAPRIAASGNGDFVVAWRSYVYVTSEGALRAQRLQADGSLLGNEILVDTDAFSLGRPRVGMDTSGAFIVTWSQEEIKARRYDPSGTALGAEFTVNTFSTDNQFSPDIAVQPSGAFVVSWVSQGGNGDIMAQRFDSAGQPVGTEIQVAPPTEDHTSPDIAIDDQGNFVIAWKFRDVGAPEPNQIQARRFASNGQPQGGTLQVTAPSTYSNNDVAVDRNGDGLFVVTWAAYVGPSGDHEVFARRYDSTGTALGDAFQVNTSTPSYQVESSVAVDDDGAFQVVWFDDGSGQIHRDISGQRFHADGTRDGDVWTASIDPANGNSTPDVTSTSDGQFLTVWADDDFAGEIFARTYRVVTVFGDGFESGDVSAWSTSAP